MHAEEANSATPAATGAGLRQGAIGWVLLAGLGISYVIAGDYSGWNFGLAHGGWGGMLAAVLFGAAMYCGVARDARGTCDPDSGSGRGGRRSPNARSGRSPAVSRAAASGSNMSAAAAVIAVFLQAYLQALTGLGGPLVVIGVFVLFVAIHSAGVGEALRVLLAMALVALFGLIVFVAATAAHVDTRRLFEETLTASTNRWLPFGWKGVWSALPFGTAFFLAVEGIAMAAEETRDPPAICRAA